MRRLALLALAFLACSQQPAASTSAAPVTPTPQCRLAVIGAAPTQLTSDARGWQWFADGAVYGGQSTMDVAGGPNDVVRFDLRTMQVTTWFSHQVRSRLLAVDRTGAALIMGEAANEEL